jgi:DNA-binding transcriptional regulator YdaS (Cro superfamily)
MKISEYLAHSEKTNVAFAVELGVPPSLLSQWATNVRPVPPRRAIEIERKSGGSVTREELCPDIDWRRWSELTPEEQKAAA